VKGVIWECNLPFIRGLEKNYHVAAIRSEYLNYRSASMMMTDDDDDDDNVPVAGSNSRRFVYSRGCCTRRRKAAMNVRRAETIGGSFNARDFPSIASFL